MTTEVQQPTWAADTRPSLRLWLALLSIPVLAVMAFAIFRPIQVLPRIALAPGYAFTDQDGERVTSEDMRGGLTLYTFSYSRCDADCADPSRFFQNIQPQIAQLDTGDIPVQFVTISFDPEADTPVALSEYARRLGADPERWRFVTGDADQLKNVIGNGFRVYYHREADGSYTFDSAYALVDGWGILRATYKGAPDPAILQRDIGLILTEARNSTGVNRFAYEAAHLFLCYPR
jgi:protein SCO1/2